MRILFLLVLLSYCCCDDTTPNVSENPILSTLNPDSSDDNFATTSTSDSGRDEQTTNEQTDTTNDADTSDTTDNDSETAEDETEDTTEHETTEETDEYDAVMSIDPADIEELPLITTLESEINVLSNDFNAKPNQFPWLVSFYTKQGDLCGGTLIAPAWVLTTASCLDAEFMRKYVVFAGTITSRFRTSLKGRSSSSKNKVEKRRVKKVFRHPKYPASHFDETWLDPNRPGFFYNVGLMYLLKPFDVSSETSVLHLLPWASNLTTDVSRECYIFGWGEKLLEHSNNSVDNILHQYTLRYKPVIAKPHFQCTMDEHTKNPFAVCVKRVLRNMTAFPCAGDRGGPLVCRGVGAYKYAIEVIGVSTKIAEGLFCAYESETYIFIGVFDTWLEETMISQDQNLTRNLGRPRHKAFYLSFANKPVIGKLIVINIIFILLSDVIC